MASPPPMMVAFGENDVKSVEDLAGCATDDLVGWTERKDGETTKHAGYLDGFDISRDEAEAHHHGRPRQGGLDRGAGAGRGRLPTRPPMTKPQPAEHGA